jgi:hypothetical protein
MITHAYVDRKSMIYEFLFSSSIRIVIFTRQKKSCTKMKFLVIFLLFVSSCFNMHAQNGVETLIKNNSGVIKNISAGAIDILMNSKGGLDKLNPNSRRALGLVRDVLIQSSDREHQKDLANSGRDQIILNVDDGRKVNLVKDENGKVYILSEGIIYPISKEIVDEAKKTSTKDVNQSKEPYKESIFEGEYEYRTTIIPSSISPRILRSTSSVLGSERYTITKNDIVYVIEKTNDLYFKVYVHGYSGYVRSTFLKRQE